MQILFRTAVAAATLALAAGAHADTPFFQSASFVDEATSQGDFSVYDGKFLGAVFTVTQAEAVSAIGGNFTQYSDGDIFGAIVRLAPGASLPGELTAANTVAHAVFTPSTGGGDQSVSLSTVLQPGRYAVVFGAGLFGTTGYSGLVSGQGALGVPSFVAYDGGTASAFTDDTLRVTVNAVAAVPEPATALLWAAGAIALGLVRRRRA